MLPGLVNTLDIINPRWSWVKVIPSKGQSVWVEHEIVDLVVEGFGKIESSGEMAKLDSAGVLKSQCGNTICANILVNVLAAVARRF